jgi:FtsP/CotA-like multicopper oxidase with cupredoxin domain
MIGSSYALCFCMLAAMAPVSEGALCKHSWVVRDHIVDYLNPERSVQTNRPVPGDLMKAGQLVNGMYPGPKIECNAGDDVEVLVINNLLDEGTTFHWHGLYMAGPNGTDPTPWADGVHRVTQAAIMPGENYTYKFKAWPPGTHFWHSHMDSLQVDKGLKGPIVFHKTDDPHKNLYDEELLIAISDTRRVPEICLKLEGQQADTGNPVCNEVDKATWNGKYGNGSTAYPYPLIEVEQGKCYRIRWLNVGGNTQNYQLTVAGHPQTLIALDSYDIHAKNVSGFNLHNGERYDTILCADQEPGNYLINATYDLACELVKDPVFSPLPPVDSCMFYAFLHYKGHNEVPKNINPKIPGGLPQGTGGGKDKKLCSFDNYKTDPDCEFYFDLNNNVSYLEVENLQHKTYQPVVADYTYTLMAGIEGPILKDPTTDPLSGPGRTFLSKDINPRKSWSNPSTPLLHTKGTCGTNDCPILNIPEDAKVVDIVLVNLSPSAHVFHLHGMNFEVINYGWPEWCDYDHHDSCFFMLPPVGKTHCKGDVMFSDNAHKDMGGYMYWGCSYNKDAPEHTKTLNVKTPIQKDMISVWRRQWAVIRIRPTNPGMWLLHCHMEQHIPTGMMIALNVLPSKQLPIPKDVPTSGTCPIPGRENTNANSKSAASARASEEEQRGQADVSFTLRIMDWVSG